jgi:hypothetical protein
MVIDDFLLVDTHYKLTMNWSPLDTEDYEDAKWSGRLEVMDGRTEHAIVLGAWSNLKRLV